MTPICLSINPHLLRRTLFGLCLPNPKPWYLVVDPNPFQWASGLYILTLRNRKLEPEKVLDFYEDCSCAKNETGIASHKTHSPVLEGLAASMIRYETMQAAVCDRKAHEIPPTLNPYPRRRNPLAATTRDGLTLQEVLEGIVEKFPKYDLSTDVSAFEALKSMEAKLAEVAEFCELPEQEEDKKRWKEDEDDD